jgi:hypothetical protein
MIKMIIMMIMVMVMIVIIITSTNCISHHIYSLILLNLSELNASSFACLGKLLLVRGTLLYVSFAADRSSVGRDTNRNPNSEKNASGNGDRNGSGDKSGGRSEDEDKAQAVVVNVGAAEDRVEEVREKEVREVGEGVGVLGEEEEDAFMRELISITRPLHKIHDSSDNHCKAKTETGIGTGTKAKNMTKTDGQHSSKKRGRDDGVDAGAGAEGGAAGYAGGCAVSVRYKEVRFIIGPPR